MRKYRTEQLHNKIDEKGSMYGQSSNEVSARVLEMRAPPEISKVNSMFEEHKISQHYAMFQKKALEILDNQRA